MVAKATAMRAYLIPLSLVLAGAGCDRVYQCDCADRPSALVLHVLDANTSSAIPDPGFSEAGTPLYALCTDGVQHPDGGAPCATWSIELVGHHVVQVSAPGYTSQTLTVDIAAAPPGCCSQGQQLEQTVKL
jgi:hypothetical protein